MLGFKKAAQTLDDVGWPLGNFSLKTDPRETQDLAAAKPELVARAEQIFKTARDNSPDWVPGDDTWRKEAIERREKAAEK